MKKMVSMFMAVAVLVGLAHSHATAADTKPIAALAVASYNDLIGDVNFVGGLVERPQLSAGLEGLLTLVTQGKGLAGVDKTRPMGAIVQANGDENPTAYVFLPVSDFKAALDLLKMYTTVDSEGGLYKLTPRDGNKASYVKQQGAWACFAEKPEMLAHCEEDPVAVLGDLEKNYIVAGRLFLANVPEAFREKFIGGLKAGIDKESGKKDGESDEEFAHRKKVLEQVGPYLVRVASELNQVAFSWCLDRTAEKTYVDLSVTAKADTETAKEMGMAAKSTTQFSGFHSKSAALNASWAGLIPPVKQGIAAGLIEGARLKGLSDIEKKGADNNRAVAKEVLNNIAELLQKVVKSGRVDGSLTVSVGPKLATGLLAGYVADGALLDKMLHSVATALLAEHPEAAPFITLDAETDGPIHFHKISVPINSGNPDQANLVQLVGDSLDVVIGIGKQNAFVAVGRDAEAALKKAISTSAKAGSKPAAPLRVSVAVKPVTAFVAAVGKPEEREPAAMADAELKKTPGKDHVALSVRPISNGVQMHLEVEQGLVRLFGRLVVSKIQPTEN